MAQQGKPRENALADYIPVNERVEKFWDKYPNGRIVTTIIENDTERGFILFRAEVYRTIDEQHPAATGHASELKSEGYVQRTSHIEVCETSAVGRALAMLGFEVKKGIASREEVENARRPQAVPLRSPASRDEQCEQVARDVKPAPVASSSEAIAKTMADLVTPKQLVAIRAITIANNINAESACLDRFGCKPEELSRRAASEFIDELKSGDEHKPQAGAGRLTAPVGMITDGQKKALDALGGRTGKNPQQVAHEMFSAAVESLTTIQAATIIQEMQKG